MFSDLNEAHPDQSSKTQKPGSYRVETGADRQTDRQRGGMPTQTVSDEKPCSGEQQRGQTKDLKQRNDAFTDQL